MENPAQFWVEINIDSFHWQGLFRRIDLNDRILAGKIFATTAAMVVVLTIYQHASIYNDPWYQRFTAAVAGNFGYLLVGILIYVVALDRISPDRDDDLAGCGRWLLSLGREGSVKSLRTFALSSLVKLFFLPLMYCYARDDWEFFYIAQIDLSSFTGFYEFAYRFAFFADVILAIVGYGLATRLLNSQVRWPEQTLGGWIFCIFCYMPFWQIIGRNYLDYNNGVFWGNVLAEGSAVYVAWGTIIICLLGVYVVATASFGSRFSNLTYRGTVWRGPYALTKHPAYIAKNMTMWMISLPFLGPDLGENLGNVLALLGVNAIYLARARFEENCCRQASDYRLYERFIRRFGLFARLARAIGGAPIPERTGKRHST